MTSERTGSSASTSSPPQARLIMLPPIMVSCVPPISRGSTRLSSLPMYASRRAYSSSYQKSSPGSGS